MGTTQEHLSWVKPGAAVLVERRFARHVAFSYRAEIARITRTSIVLDNGERFRRNSYDEYVMVPRYLDYTTVAIPAPTEAGEPR